MSKDIRIGLILRNRLRSGTARDVVRVATTKDALPGKVKGNAAHYHVLIVVTVRVSVNSVGNRHLRDLPK